MGRPKTYHRAEVLQRAMEQFWMHGYAASTTADLASAMGINRYSLYNEFESKHALYLAALDRYIEREVPGFLRELLAPDAGLDGIVAVFERFGAAAGMPGTERGCLACNAATEVSAHDGQTRAEVARYVAVLQTGFRAALCTAVARGELDRGLEVEAWTGRLTTTLIGIFVLIRSQVDGALARGAAETAVRELRAAAPGSPKGL